MTADNKLLFGTSRYFYTSNMGDVAKILTILINRVYTEVQLTQVHFRSSFLIHTLLRNLFIYPRHAMAYLY
jgi:hypothetical protein